MCLCIHFFCVLFQRDVYFMDGILIKCVPVASGMRTFFVCTIPSIGPYDLIIITLLCESINYGTVHSITFFSQ
jgi:hypothetical protein